MTSGWFHVMLASQMQTRRSFLGAAAGLLTAAGVLAASVHADQPKIVMPKNDDGTTDWLDFERGGHRVRWMGWRTPMNQVVTFGLWVAWPIAKSFDKIWVASTLGSVTRVPEMEVIDSTFYKDYGTKLMPWSTEEDKISARRKALKNLFSSLSTGV